MSKLASKAKNSKLKETLQQDSSSKSESKKEKLVRQVKYNHPRSYRFDAEIINTLKETLYKINEITPKKVSEARLVKALIWLSKEIEEEKIVKALKEVW